jgi:hypothetical protein
LNSFVSSNLAYIKQFFAYETGYAQSVGLISRILNVEGYTADTQIVLVGMPAPENGSPELDSLRLTGVNETLFHVYSFPLFLQRYLGFTQPLEWKEDGIVENPEIANVIAGMPQYPDDGSVAFVGEDIYVKFSDAVKETVVPDSQLESQSNQILAAINKALSRM